MVLCRLNNRILKCTPIFRYSFPLRDLNSNGRSFSNDLRTEIDKKFDDLKSKSVYEKLDKVPKHADIVVIGGGAVGLGVAHWLKKNCPRSLTVAVIERDPSYSKASTNFPMSGLRLQFGLKEHIQMAKYSAEYFRELRDHLSIPDVCPPNIFFNHEGFLTLAKEEDAELLEESYELQRSCGVKVDLLMLEHLRDKFPWMNTSDIKLATYGLEDEGWFNPGFLLALYKMKCASDAVQFVNGEVVGFIMEEFKISTNSGKAEVKKKLTGMKIKTPDENVSEMEFAACINCAGPWSKDVALLAGFGAVEEGHMSVELPIEARRRIAYTIYCPDGPALETPVILDTSGIYIRREGIHGHYICGTNMPKDNEQDDKTFFESVVRPAIAHRVPAFKKCEVTQTMTGLYDHNHFDGSPIIGNHPSHRNFLMATGFGGEGPQFSPAVGRAMYEFVIRGNYESIDLKDLMVDRIYSGEKVIDPAFARLYS